VNGNRPRVLIEEWLPIAEVGVESQREHGFMTPFPAPVRLHVWWARRPLMACRAAVLASTLPAWSPEWPSHLRAEFPTEKEYRGWLIHQLGVRGDPVAARLRVRAAAAAGITLKKTYDGPRAFMLTPDRENLELQRRLLRHAWGTEEVAVADPMAGGGSIPLEALRFGYRAFAGELNPVAAVILLATLEYPARFGPGLADEIKKWGNVWAERVRKRLEPFFPVRQGESIQAYIFARTVACPETGKPVPLSPNWWLRRGSDPVGVRLIAEPDMNEPRFEIVRGRKVKELDPDAGTAAGGDGRSPWTGAPIPSDYIKAEAQAGRMGQVLYAVAVKEGKRRDFRAPTEEDVVALETAERELWARWDEWERADLIPTEAILEGSKTREPRNMGMTRWCDLFSPRQLVAVVTAVEELRRLGPECNDAAGNVVAAAVQTYLALAVSKVVNYNARLASWHAPRGVVRSVFDQHNYAFKATFAEFDAAHSLLPWAVDQVVDAYRGLSDLVEPSRGALFPDRPEAAADLVEVRQGNAADLRLADGSLHAVVVDPPYYANVQYAELSDFFYVWEKRSLGHLYPALFATELTDKAPEAVANPVRFEQLDKKKAKDLARADYERKMTACFREMHRVLRHDGVLTVMFTHKEVEAWDTLGRSLIEAGFVIESSWPVHTESEHSLHQAGKAAAASTILLACRKREVGGESEWWDDLKGEVRRTARARAQDFQEAGISGVDLYIATFGPTLSVISRQWPVLTSEVDEKTGEPRPLRPEEALELAREEVASLRRRGLLLGRSIEFDPVTDWYVLAWDAFGVEAPFDEARKLGLALGVDVQEDLVKSRIVAKKSGTVVLQEPPKRRHPGLADPDGEGYGRLIDSAHALMIVFTEDGVRGAERWLKRTGLGNDARFQGLLQALVNAIPRTKVKGEFVRAEARALDGLRVLFPDLVVPEEPEPELVPEQQAFEVAGDAPEEG